MSKNQPTRDRFMEKVDTNGPNGCWNFTSSIHKTGCGQFTYQGRSRSAYRIGYEILIRPLGPDEILHHVCENRLCVNPAHLQVTTQKEHIADLTPTHLAYKNKRRTHCPMGHPLEEPNLVKSRLPYRICLACAKRRVRESTNKRRAKDRAKTNAQAREWHAKWRNANREKYRANARAYYARKQLRLKLKSEAH